MKCYRTQHNAVQHYTTLYVPAQFYNSAQCCTTHNSTTPLHNSVQPHTTLHSSTQLYTTIHSTQSNKSKQLYTAQHNSLQVYVTQNSTQLYKSPHNMHNSQLYTTLYGCTPFYNTVQYSTQYTMALHNSEQLYRTLQNRAQLSQLQTVQYCTTLQTLTQLYRTVWHYLELFSNFFRILMNFSYVYLLQFWKLFGKVFRKSLSFRIHQRFSLERSWLATKKLLQLFKTHSVLLLVKKCVFCVLVSGVVVSCWFSDSPAQVSHQPSRPSLSWAGCQYTASWPTTPCWLLQQG